MNRPILMQIGASGPRSMARNGQLRWSGVQRSRSHEADYRFGGLGRVQQLTGVIGLSIGPAYVRPVSCWTTFIVIQ